jgi:ankyrin repeat protein
LGESVGQSVQSDKTTLLHMAARFGCAETTEALLNAGVPGDALDDCGRTPLIVAFVHDRWDLVKWLLEAKIGRLQTSIDRKSLDRINVNQKTESGCLAIHFAAAAGRQDLVDLLIEVGADINERVAPSFGHGVRSIEWLRGCGLGLAAGATPLDLARMGKHWKVADGLKKRGAVSGLGN